MVNFAGLSPEAMSAALTAGAGIMSSGRQDTPAADTTTAMTAPQRADEAPDGQAAGQPQAQGQQGQDQTQSAKRYSFLSDDVASRLGDATRGRLDALEQNLAALRAENAGIVEGWGKERDSGAITQQEYEQRMAANKDFLTNNKTGMAAIEDDLRRFEESIARGVTATDRMADRMGAPRPASVDVEYAGDTRAERSESGQDKVVLSQRLMEKLNDKELDFVAAHEVAHTLGKPPAPGGPPNPDYSPVQQTREYQADGRAIEATQDIDSARTALRKANEMDGVRADQASPTHPTETSRVSNMAEVLDNTPVRPMGTPPAPASRGASPDL